MANPPPRYDKPRVFVKSIASETYSLSEARRQHLSSVPRVIRKDYRDYLDGKAREMGLGGLSKIGLADARRKAAAQRVLLSDRVDPLHRREAENAAKKIEAARAMSFDGKRATPLRCIMIPSTGTTTKTPITESSSW